MTQLSLALPARTVGVAENEPIWRFFASNILRVETRQAPTIDIAVGHGPPHRFKAGDDGERAGKLAITSTLELLPTKADRLSAFFDEHGAVSDHVGINLSLRDCSEADWQALIDEVALVWPAYRLHVGSPNDIVMIVVEQQGETDSVVELVLDRLATFSSIHACLRINADRAALEDAFPPICGGYKPGDEAFFLSVALQPALRIPTYFDLAFRDGGLTPWREIVAAMGTRIG